MLGVGLRERGSAAGTYCPGRVLAQLGALAVGRRRVLECALPHMRELSARTHLTSVLSLWGTAGDGRDDVERDAARRASGRGGGGDHPRHGWLVARRRRVTRK